MKHRIEIGNSVISNDTPVYVIAEMSANHLMSFERAKEIIYRLRDSGVNAVKMQTYTADTITLDSHRPEFKIDEGLWAGETLYSLYQKAYTPWEWQEDLMHYANSLGMDCFSSPFDLTAVDFMEQIRMPAYKVASYEINDIPMLRKIAKTGKPVMISTGVAHLEDIDRAVRTCLAEENENVILLKCTSAYPCPYEEMNLQAIPLISETFDCVVGLSDHTLGSEVALGAVALGARVVEKHVTIKRSDGGPDGSFSMEIEEFTDMVRRIRNLEKALGKRTFQLRNIQEEERSGMRSLYVVRNIRQGEYFSPDNIRSIRPGMGLQPVHYEEIIGKKASCDIERGTPLDWSLVL